MNKQIGWYNLREAKIFTNSFETAAWYEDVLVQPGRYPIEVIDYKVHHFDDEKRRRFNGEITGHIGGAYVNMKGTIVSDNFQSLFYGMPIGEPYDTAKNSGKPSDTHFFMYLYSLADSILNDPATPYELFPEYEAVEDCLISSYDGKPLVTHSIRLKSEHEIWQKTRDEELEKIWALFEDIPMNPETECMEEPFLDFPAGTHREEIWHWFDERYTGGVRDLLYSPIPF